MALRPQVPLYSRGPLMELLASLAPVPEASSPDPWATSPTGCSLRAERQMHLTADNLELIQSLTFTFSHTHSELILHQKTLPPFYQTLPEWREVKKEAKEALCCVFFHPHHISPGPHFLPQCHPTHRDFHFAKEEETKARRRWSEFRATGLAVDPKISIHRGMLHSGKAFSRAFRSTVCGFSMQGLNSL